MRAAVNPAQDEHRSAVRARHLDCKRALYFVFGCRRFDHGEGRIHRHFRQRAIGQTRGCLKLQ